MPAPDPEGMSLLAKVVAAATAVVVPVWGARTWFEKRFSAKADKNAVDSQFQDVKNELAIHRQHIGKVFDQIRESEGKNEQRHRELLMHLIEKKAD